MVRQSASSLEILFCAVLFFILLYVAWKNRLKNDRKDNIILVAGILLLCLFSFWGGDYFHYREAFDSYKTSKDIYHIEETYLPIFEISRTYTIFRLIIWGTAFALLYYARRILKIEKSFFLFSFIFLYLFRFSYARVSLPIAIIMLGYAIIISRNKFELWTLLLGSGVIYLGLPFHKSSILAIVGLLIGLFFTKKKTAIALLLLTPLFIRLVGLYLFDYIDANNLIEDELVLSSYNLYTQSDATNIGLGQLVFNILELSSIYYMFFYQLWCIYFKKVDTAFTTRLMFSAFAGLVFLATCFAFTTPIIHQRVLFMAMAPMMLSFAMIYDKIKDFKGTRFGLLLMLLYQSYYILYNWRVIGAL